MRAEELKVRLDEAIKEAVDCGYEIMDCMWVRNASSTCCPLGALMLKYVPSLKFSFTDPAIYVRDGTLGIEEREAYSFADGFDGRQLDKSIHSYNFWNLGRQYRDKYLRGKI